MVGGNKFVWSVRHGLYRRPRRRLLWCLERMSVANRLALTIGGKGEDAGGVGVYIMLPVRNILAMKTAVKLVEES